MTSYQDTISFLEQNLKFRCRIPLRNRKKEIVEYAIVDAEDYPEVNKRMWNLFKKKNQKNLYAESRRDKMHIFLLGRHPDPNYVIDHLNGNGLDNRRSNLKHRTFAENAQNAIRIKTDSHGSKFIGVYSERNKWRARIASHNLGVFDNEEAAATQYDKAAFILYGENAKTNKTIMFEDVRDMKFDEIVRKKEDGKYGKNIRIKRNKYIVVITHNKKKIPSPCFKTIEEAIQYRQTIYDKIEQLEQEELKIHHEQEILRNNEGIAVIPVTKGNTKVYALVDDDIWHELMQYRWSLNKNYPNAVINKRLTLMHHYIFGVNKFTLEGKVIDHISRNPLDNRRSQLRISTFGQNAQNRTSNKTHVGVYKHGPSYFAHMIINGIKTSIFFDIEIKASIVYNLRCRMNDYVMFNPILVQEYISHKDEILNKLVKQKCLLTEDDFNRLYDQLISDHSVEA